MSTGNDITQLAAQLAQLIQTLAEHHEPIAPAAARAMPERTLLTQKKQQTDWGSAGRSCSS
jgi:hypothetical protein